MLNKGTIVVKYFILLQLFISPNRRAYIFLVFFYIDYDITTRKKKLFQMADNKVETQNRDRVSAEGTVRLVPVPTPAGAEAARAAATSAAAAEIAPCAAEATALVAASAPTVAVAAAILLT